MSTTQGTLVKELNNFHQCVFKLRLLNDEGKTCTVNAIIDTGTYHSLIPNNVVLKLGLVSNGTINKMEGVGGNKIESKEYNIKVIIDEISPTNYLECPFSATGMEEAFTGIDIMIGAQVLRYFVFKYNEPEGYFTLSLK